MIDIYYETQQGFVDNHPSFNNGNLLRVLSDQGGELTLRGH